MSERERAIPFPAPVWSKDDTASMILLCSPALSVGEVDSAPWGRRRKNTGTRRNKTKESGKPKGASGQTLSRKCCTLAICVTHQPLSFLNINVEKEL